MGPERPDQAVLLEVAGPELEDQRPHLGERLALEVAQLSQLRPGRRRVAVEQELDRAGHEGHREQRLGDRVVELAGEVGPLLARRPARRPGGAGPARGARARLMSRVEPWIPAKPPVDVDHADRADLDRDEPAVLAAWRSMLGDLLRASGSATSAVQRSIASAGWPASTIFEKCSPISSSGLKPVIRSIDSDMNVKMPSASVEKTTSGEFSTRNR